MPRARKQPVSPVASNLPAGEAPPAELGKESLPKNAKAVTPPAPVKPGESPKRLSLAEYNSMDLWTAMERMTEVDWTDKMLYVYRSKPFTMNRTTGVKYGYIYCGGFPGMTKDQIKQTFGGGQFRLYLKMGQTSIYDAHFTANGEPILKEDEDFVTRNPKEGVPASAPIQDGTNAAMLGLVQTLLDELRNRGEVTADAGTAEAVTKSIEMMAEAARKSNQLVADANKAPTMTDQLALVERIVQLSGGKNDVTMIVLKLLLDRMVPGAGAAPTAANPVSTFKDMVEAMRAVKEIFPESESGAGSWVKDLVVAVVPAIRELAGAFARQQAAPVQVILPDGRVVNARRTQSVPSAAQPVNAPIPAAGPTPAGVAATEAQPPAAETPQPAAGENAVANIKAKLVRMFYQGKEGSLAASFIEEASPTMFANLKGGTVELLKQYMASDPILGVLVDEQDINPFLQELLDYVNEVPPGDEPPAATAVQVPATA